MKKLFIIANWKSNKDSIQVNDWIEGFKNYNELSDKEVIVCPSFAHLSIFKSYILNHKSKIKIGAQDISCFDEGPYTGEVNGKQIKESADYVIVGHSERRKNFGESDETIVKKIEMAQKYNLAPILCISELDQISTSHLSPFTSHLIIAYEPLSAVGSGTPDSSEHAESMAQKIKSKLSGACVLYGGSVTSENVKTFTNLPNIDGVLVGSSSLDPLEFLAIVENA